MSRNEMSSIAETWVAGFAEGWRAPTGPDAFVAHFHKRVWPLFLRLQARQLVNRRPRSQT